MATKKQKTHAVLTITDAAKMSPKRRKEISLWLRRQAAFLVGHAGEMSSRFTARFID